ncbi:MAG: peptidoglycan DD-metalloendopeptidase family protein [Calditrichaeota bacterium]|nr:peptidoglycan DD-metalloendopeptidase family protein [Calditrichota bacterium]
MSVDLLNQTAQAGAYMIAFLQAELLYSIVLFIPIWILLRLFGKRSAYLQLGLCTLLLLRLVVPPSWASPLSARNLLAPWPPFQASWEVISGLIFSGGSDGANGLTDEGIGAHSYLPGEHQTLEGVAAPAEDPAVQQMLLLLAWLGGAAGLGGLFLQRRRRYRRLTARARAITDPAILETAAHWRQAFRITRPVRLCSAGDCTTPFTIGIFRPVIFLPRQVAALHTPRLLEAIIAHEMAHIRRYDDLWIRLQILLQAIYFFHPVVWYANRRLNQARERICDRMVLARRQISPREYGESMLAVLRLNQSGTEPWKLYAGFSNDHQFLVQRIHDIKGGSFMKKHHPLVRIAVLMLIGLFLLPMASYQSLADDRPVAENPPAMAGPAFDCPIKTGYVSSGYGNRIHPVKKVKMLHRGIDVAAPRGSEIYAAAAGTVILSKFRENYGNTVILRHGDDYTTLYSQMDTILVSYGQQVDAGTLIGLVGDSGLSTAPHLHFELRHYDKALDPESMIDFSGLKKKDGN